LNFPTLRYVLCIRKNALQVLIPKYGLEGTIYVAGKDNTPLKSGVKFTYSEEVSVAMKSKLFCFPFEPYKGNVLSSL
jgi:exosome complex exonuclease DIS3/RRP44